MKHIFTLSLALLGQILFAQQDQDTPKAYPPMISKGELLGSVPPLRDLEPHTLSTASAPKKLWLKRNYFFANKLNNPDPLPRGGDPLAKPLAAERSTGPEISPGFNFEGLHDNSVSPPDPSGDVGKDHYVQMVNSSSGAWFQVWDKVTGNSVYGPAPTSTIWSEVNTGSIGDPIIQYDHAADRWLMMEMQSFFGNELLLAISDNGDPTGGWKAYRFQTLGFPDYPKLYVWPNAYFVTANEITSGNECSGYALERASILAGEPFFDLHRFVMPNYQAIAYQPATGADWEGGPPPPPGSPGYIFRVYDDAWDGGTDHLQIWEVNVNWQTPGLSNIEGPTLIYPAPFETKVCHGQGLFDCIEQPDPSAPRITALENIIMYRAPYRNFGDHESVVFNHVTDVSGQIGDGGDAAVRWYELHKTGGGNWQIHQQGTYAPDLVTNRFMATICTDEAGNIALGYTGCSENTHPGLYLTGRRNGDPLGTLPVEEYTLMPGGKSHYGDNRWGDYSNMCVDPVDGKTFWFTGEYQPQGQSWGTRIGSFRIQRDTFDVSPATLNAPIASPFLGDAETVKVQVVNGGIEPASGVTLSLFFEGNLVANDNLPGTLLPGESVEHTFSQTVAMPVPGKNYHFRILTHFGLDQFVKNDTLDKTVKKLTTNDASLVGKHNLPGLVCGSEVDFGLIIRNTAALPMQSAIINWRVNSQPFQAYQWTGLLGPGERDTVTFHANGIVNGLNSLRAFTTQPNGLEDQTKSNDTLLLTKFYGNLDGTYLTAEAQTQLGILHWELRNQANQSLSSGDLSSGQSVAQICGDAGECYRLVLRASTFSWQGHFRLLDIFGQVLIEAYYASTEETVYNICIPLRQQIDVGALALVSPTSGPDLTASEPVKIRLRNFGLTPQSNLEVAYRLNGGTWNTETVAGPLAAGATIDHLFAGTEDLSTQGGVYNFELKTTVTGDEDTDNDTTNVTVLNRYLRDLEVLHMRKLSACNDPSNVLLNLQIRNHGIETDHSFDIAYAVNGVPQPSAPHFLSLNPDETTEITLFVTGAAFGQNTVSVDLTNLNGPGEDQDPTNDISNLGFVLSPEGFPVQFYMSLDENPSETTWELRDQQGNLISAGGPYTQTFQSYNDEFCLEADSCYVFRLLDSGGNGMNGYAQLLLSGNLLWSFGGGDFGSEIVVPFCAASPCSNLALNADVTPASGPGIADGQIIAQPSGGVAPYLFSLDNGLLQDTPVFADLLPGTYKLVCSDAVGCTTELLVTLGTVAAHEPGLRRLLHVTPNPTSGLIRLEIAAAGSEHAAICDVFDSRGKLLQSARMVRWNDTLRGMAALDTYSAGVYFLKIRGLEKEYTARVVKK